MAKLLKAIQYRNLDEARRLLAELADPSLIEDEILDDAGEEPQGLLAVVPEDRLPEKLFYRLLDTKKGVLVEVEKIPYSGYGPPSEDDDYIGFTREQVAYVLKGCRLPVEIKNCPQGARDIHHLEAMVLDQTHSLDRTHLQEKLGLGEAWDFDDLFELILSGAYTAEQIDRLIHQAVH